MQFSADIRFVNKILARRSSGCIAALPTKTSLQNNIQALFTISFSRIFVQFVDINIRMEETNLKINPKQG